MKKAERFQIAKSFLDLGYPAFMAFGLAQGKKYGGCDRYELENVTYSEYQHKY